jgi:hypothetical protein
LIKCFVIEKTMVFCNFIIKVKFEHNPSAYSGCIPVF